jgi:ribosome-binding factor A
MNKKHKGSAPSGSQRQLRVGETVRHAVADILSQGSVHDPDLEGHIITVPEVRMSPDLNLRFRVDERFDEAERIEKLLRTPAVQRDLAPDTDDK